MRQLLLEHRRIILVQTSITHQNVDDDDGLGRQIISLSLYYAIRRITNFPSLSSDYFLHYIRLKYLLLHSFAFPFHHRIPLKKILLLLSCLKRSSLLFLHILRPPSLFRSPYSSPEDLPSLSIPSEPGRLHYRILWLWRTPWTGHQQRISWNHCWQIILPGSQVLSWYLFGQHFLDKADMLGDPMTSACLTITTSQVATMADRMWGGVPFTIPRS